jgi:hypothetical protein
MQAFGKNRPKASPTFFFKRPALGKYQKSSMTKKMRPVEVVVQYFREMAITWVGQ